MREDWEFKKIGDVLKTGAGGTPLKRHKEYYEGGDIPWLLSGEVGNRNIIQSENFITKQGLSKSSAKLFPINTVLVAMYGATAGETGILRFEACTNQAVCGIFPSENLIPEFLYYCMLIKKEELIAKATGNAQPNISQIKIKNTEIPIPPLAEQKRIVEILDEAFDAIDQAKANIEQNIQNAEELFQSKLNEIFSQKGEGWEEKSVKQLMDEEIILKPKDGNHGSIHPKSSDYSESGVPFIMASDLENGEVNTTDCKFIKREQADSLRKGFAKSGDILLSHKATIGRVAELKTSLDYIMLTPQVTYYRIINNKILDNRYLYHFFRSRVFQNEMMSYAKTGSTRAYIGITKQQKLHINYPTIEEQEEIVKMLNNFEPYIPKLIKEYQRKTQSLEELKNPFFKKHFRES
ncbi:MAG: restriction endonuclease subunit S [Balneola sp.]